MMSACVKWTKEHVDDFNRILLRQLSSVEEGSEAWTECMERAKLHARMLAEAGLDFTEFVGVPVKEDGKGA